MKRTNIAKPPTPDTAKVRLDKWLWAARFFKTRNLAKAAIAGGKIRYNGERPKAGRLVEAGAKLSIRQGWSEKTIVVLKLSENRGPAPLARELYEETEQSIQQREEQSWQRQQLQAAQMPPARRPGKKQRRQIHRFKEARERDSEKL